MSGLEQFEKEFVHPKPGRTLIVGSQIYGGKEDRRLRYPNALGVDMLPGPGVDQVIDLEEDVPDGQFDHIEVMSVLEHSRRPWLMAANLGSILAPGGTIFVSVPFCWRIHAYPNDYWRISPEGLKQIFPFVKWSHVALVTDTILKGDKIPRIKVDGYPYMARTETCGFGFQP